MILMTVFNGFSARLTPMGLNIRSNVHTHFDMTATKDRLGNWTDYGYDSLRRKIAETNALGEIHLIYLLPVAARWKRFATRWASTRPTITTNPGSG